MTGCVFIPMFIFLKIIYSWNDETRVLEVLEIKIFFSAKESLSGFCILLVASQ